MAEKNQELGAAGVSADEVRTTAELARLHLRPEEVPEMAAELSAILAFAARLGEVDVTGVEPTTHAVRLFCPLREDTVGPHISLEAALASAPAAEPPYFTVPAMLPQGGSDGSG